jgi:AcrR family transcriptional regulator
MLAGSSKHRAEAGWNEASTSDNRMKATYSVSLTAQRACEYILLPSPKPRALVLMPISNSSPARRGLPRGPHGLTPADVARSQRERLLAALAEAIVARGYTGTPVSEVIERAGVSRKTFYVHFQDRQDCLMAACAVAVEGTLARARTAAQRAGGGRNQLPATITALCEAAAESPGTSSLQVAEAAAAGPAGLRLRNEAVLSLGSLLRAGLMPASSAPATAVMGMIAGGLLRFLASRALAGKLKRSQTLTSELARWIRSYHPAPAGIARLGGGPLLDADGSDAEQALIGGRAPGTLSLAPRWLLDSTRVSPSFTAHSQRERILDAVASLSASKGYVGLTVDEIVTLAGVSLNTFYEHFTDKEDAFLVAQEVGHVRGAAVLEQTLARSSSWDAGVRDGIGALLGFFSSEPAFARLAAVEAPIATPQASARARHHLAGYATLLLEGAPRGRRPPSIAADVIAAALHEAAFALAVGGPVRDPTRARSYATYLVLAPFLGPGNAFAAAAAPRDAKSSARNRRA